MYRQDWRYNIDGSERIIMRVIIIFLFMHAINSNVSLSSKSPVKNVSKKINKVI